MDLDQQPPRRWSATIAGMIWLPRLIDKARAFQAGTLGTYAYPSALDQSFMRRFQLTPAYIESLVRGTASDAAIGAAVRERAEVDLQSNFQTSDGWAGKDGWEPTWIFDQGGWARPGKLYAGRVRELAPMTDSATRQYTARIAIVDADPAIELGMTAHVRLAGERGADVYRLPLTALYQKNGKSFVWIVAPDSLAHLREVEVADVARDAVVVADGIAAGETVVTAGVNLLFEGQHVRRAATRAAGEV